MNASAVFSGAVVGICVGVGSRCGSAVEVNVAVGVGAGGLGPQAASSQMHRVNPMAKSLHCTAASCAVIFGSDLSLPVGYFLNLPVPSSSAAAK